MLEKLSHFPINWIDGMKINKSHFLAMQDNFVDITRDAIGVNVTPISYGLLPVENSMQSVKISLVIDNHKLLRVKLEECHAITPNGTRIEINPAQNDINMQMAYPEEVYDLEEVQEMVLFVNIIVNPFDKVSFGELDPEENPPRYPYLAPTYKLHLTPEGSMYQQTSYTGYQLSVGKIIINKDETRLQEDYVPPCTTASSHKSLVDMHTRIDKFMGQMELYTIQIAQKINRKQQTNSLAIMVLNMSNLIISYLGSEINALRWFGLHESPAYMFDKVIRMARIMKNYVDAKSGDGKEELLNYLAEWCGLAQGDFETLFTDTVNIGYNHTQIDKTRSQVTRFIINIENLFAALNKLDYIGKRSDTGIFVKEKSENDPISKIKRSRFFEE